MSARERERHRKMKPSNITPIRLDSSHGDRIRRGVERRIAATTTPEQWERIRLFLAELREAQLAACGVRPISIAEAQREGIAW